MKKRRILKKKKTELETFLNNNGDLQSYISKEFTPFKQVLKTLSFLKKDEIKNNNNKRKYSY